VAQRDRRRKQRCRDGTHGHGVAEGCGALEAGDVFADGSAPPGAGAAGAGVVASGGSASMIDDATER
jgi:hypothetical protein